MLGDVETFGEKRLLEAHGLSVAWGVWGAVLVGQQKKRSVLVFRE